LMLSSLTSGLRISSISCGASICWFAAN
jgi:hypothetical protein